MKRFTFLTRLAFITGLFVATTGSALATVTLTGASGGGNIPADTASNAPAPAWTTLGAITLTEGASTDFTNGSAVTLVLRVPAGFQFNTAVTPDISFVASKNITSASVAMTDSSNVTVTLTVSGTAVTGDSLTIGSTTGIQVRPTAGTPLATGKHIYRPSTGGGTAGINGITTSTDGSTGSNFGTLTEVAGSSAAIRVETKADGSGTVVGTQSITAANAITNYAISRDAFSNFVANVAADSWSLTGITGGVAGGDLVPSGDSKSAIFTAHLIGSAVIHAPSGSLTTTDSGTLTVVGGPASKLVFITAPQSLTAGVSSSVITVQIQDAGGNPTNATAARKITLSSTSGGGTFRNLADTVTITSITNAIGQNATNFLYKDTVVGTPTITAATTSPTTLVSATQVETVNPANAAMVRVETAADGSGTIVAAQNIIAGNALTVYAITRDAFSNFVANVAADSWSLTGVTGGVLGGDLVPAGDNMSATFTGHVIGSAKIHAPSGALTATDSGVLTVVPGPVTQLTFTTQPGNATAGAVFGTQPVVNSQDQFGNNSTNGLPANANISVSLTAGTGPLQGITITNIGLSGGKGIGAYTNLRIDVAGTDKQLTATSTNSLASEASSVFTVSPAAASKLVIATQPSATATAGQTFTQQPVIQIQDAFNNLRNADTLTVTATRSAGTGTLQGTTAIAAVAGVATYTDLSHLVATNITLAFTSGVLSSVTSSVVAVSAATPALVRVETKADGSGTVVGTQSITAANAITNYAISRDAFSNFVANVAADSWSLTGITGGVAGGDLVPSGDSKSAIFTAHLIGSAVIHAPSGSLTTTDSGTLTVVGGPASKLVFITAPQSLTAGVSSSVITVQIQDAGGNPTNATAARKITLSSTSGGGTFRNLADTVTITSITNAIGQNATNFLYKDTVVGTPTITAATTSPTTLVSATQVETVNPANAAMVRVETAADGSGTIVAAQNIIAGNALTVYAITRDAFSNFVANVAADSWSLTGVTGGVLGGDLVPAGDNMSATFTGHVIGSAKIHAPSGALTATDSGVLTVVPGPVTQLTFTTQPGNATAGAVFGTQPVVNSQDQFGNNSTNGLPATANISVSLTAGTGPLQGITITNIGLSGGKGIGAYTNLRIDVAGTDKQLTATSTNSLASEASSVFTVSPAAASKLVIATQPSATATAGQTFTQQPVIQIQDAFNNLRNADTLTVTATRSAGTGTLQGTTAIAAVAGVATYTDLSHLVATNITLAFTSGVLSSVTSSVVAVSAATPALVRVETKADGSGTVVGTQSITAANAITNYAISRDAFSNFVANVAADSWSLTGITGGVAGGDLVPSGDSKSAIFTAHLIGSAVIHAPSGSLTTTDSGTLTVVGGPASKLVFITAPQSLTAGVSSSVITVQIQDAGGNPTNATAARKITLSSTSGGGTFRNLADTVTITSITNAIGQNATNFLYKDTVVGTPTITAATTSPTTLVSATQVETVNPANAAMVRVETAADGSGTIVAAQNIIAGNALTVYAITRDAFSNFVANVAADSWSLTGVTGGVLGGDLVPAGDNMSATFTGHVIGSAKIHAPSGALTATDSGVLTVVPGPVTQLTFTTQPGNATAGAVFGTQPVVNSQDQFGNNSTNGLPATANISVSLTAGAGPLQGITITNIGLSGGKGIGAYTNLRIDVAGTDKQLTATSTNSLASEASSVFTVNVGALNHYAVSASSPQTRGTPFTVTVTAQDAGNNTVPDSSTVVTMSANSANVQFDGRGDNSFTSNTSTLTNGVFTINLVDNFAETVTVTATDGNGKTGTSGSIAINPVAGDFISRATGNWNATTTWSNWTGSAWVNATTTPAGGAGTNITIQSAHTVTDNVAVNLSGTLMVNGTLGFTSPGVITVGSGGILQNAGTVNASVATLIFNSGSIYEHNFTTTSGTIPTATWNSGSTCEIIGYTSNNTAPNGLTQSFANFTWNCPNQSVVLKIGTGALSTVNGNFALVNTGTGTLEGTTSGTFALTVGGDMIIQGGTFLASASGGGTLNIGGSYNQTGGTFSNGSVDLAVAFTGANKTFTQSGGTLNPANLNFTVNPGASLTLNNGISVGTGQTFIVNGSLDCNTNIVNGAGTFTLASGGTLIIGDPNGITASGATGNIQTTTRSFNAAGNYTYDGTTAQVTGSGLTSANNLIITNSAGVTLSVTTTNTGVLTLANNLLATAGNTLVVGSTGTISGVSASIYVNGTVQKVFSTGNGQSFTFPIGDASNYTPINLSSLNVTTAGSLTAKTTPGDHPQIAGSGINSSADVNRYWTLTNSPAGIVVSADTATFNFVSGDLDAGANTANFVVRRYNGTWTNTTTVSRGATSTAASGIITNFGDFAIGDQLIDHYAVGAVSPQTAGNAFNTTVTAQDKLNQTVPDSSTLVTMTANSGNVQFDANGDSIFGDNTNILSNGTFAISTKDNVAETFTVTATDGNNKTGNSSSITNIATTPNAIVFVQGPPSSATAGATLSPAVTVQVTDVFNNPVNGVSVNMTLNGGGTLGGTTTRTTTNGIATFNTLSVSQAGSKTLTAGIISPSLSVTSAPFTVNPAGAVMVRVETASDGSGTVVPAQNVTAGSSVTVYAITRDAFTNFVGNPSATWLLTNVTGGVKSTDLSPATGTSAVFTGHWVGSAVIHATSGALGATNSGTLTVVPGAAANLFVTLPGQTFTNSVGNGGTASNLTAGATFNVKLTAADPFTNIATSYIGAKAISYSGPGGSPSYATSVTFTNGQSSNTLATVLFKAETTTITATDGSLIGIPSSNLTVKPATYNKLQLLVPGESAAPGTASGKTGTPNAQTVAVPLSVTVNAVDTNWNVIATNDIIKILSSDTGAALPATNALSVGTQTFNVTFLTAGNQTLTASNVTHTAITANTSPAITVNKGNQTITFNALPDHTYGDSPFALNATASSGLAVTFSIVSGPATIAGNTLTITGTGTVTVDTAQAGNANWNAATDVQQSFNVAQANQTITFNPLPNHTYGDAPFALSATASSGLPVSFSIVSGPATIAGNTLTITGTGTVTVDAAQAGNANWNAAADVQQSFNVAKGGQTITFNPLPTHTYGDAPLTLNAAASSGLVVAFSVASGPATLSGNALTITGPGTVQVNADQAGDANWNAAATVQQSFVVNPASLTVSGITASNKVYDGTTTAILNTTGATLIGAVGGDDVALDTNGATGAFSDANVATNKNVIVSGLTLTGATAGNYTLTQPTATADITPATLTVTADNTNKVYGATIIFTGAEFTSSGLIGSDTVGSVALTSDGATNTAWVGNYNIMAGGATGTGLANYSINYTPGTLVVTQAVLTVTADNQLRPYGQTNPLFTVSYHGFVNNDDTNVLSGSPDLSTAADTNSPVGTYVITNSLGNLSATNYSFVFSNGVLTVGTVTLTPGVTVGDKVYDGTTNATITGYSLSGVVGNDDVSLTNGLASFADKNVGTNKPVTVTGLSLAGADVGKYALATNTVIITAGITPQLLTVSAAADSKVYDGTTASTATPTITVGSVQAGDSATFTQSYDTANAGTNKTLTPAGSINDGNGGNNYTVTLAPDTNGVIASAPLTITADSTNKAYGATVTFAGTEFSSSGLIGSDTVGSVTLTSDGATNTASVGHYDILVGGAAGTGLANYSISYINGVLVVTPVALTVTVDNQLRTYGQTNPVLSGSVSSNGDGITASFSTVADTNSPVGSYPITVLLDDPNNKLGNYTTTTNNGVLSVTNALLTVSADNANKPFGQTMVFAGTEFTVSGLVSTDSVSGASLSSAGAGSSAEVGIYPIAITNAVGDDGLTNYLITYVPGTLTVNTVTVVASDNFDRPDGPIGANWENTLSSQGNFVITNDVVTVDTENAHVEAFWAANSFSADQYSEATLTSIGPWTGVILRGDGNWDPIYTNSGSQFYLGFVFGPNDYRIYHWINGAYYQETAGTTETWQTNDVLRLEISGSVEPLVTMYRNGNPVLLWLITDSADVKTEGSPGIGIYSRTGAGLTIDNWEGGNLNPDTNAPATPANLAASAAGPNQINLSWTPATDDIGVVGYLVERSQGTGATNFFLLDTPVGTNYVDDSSTTRYTLYTTNSASLLPGTTYNYRLRATDAAGNTSGYSEVVTATTPIPPLPTISPIPDQTTLVGTSVGPFPFYISDPGVNPTFLTATATSSDTNLVPGENLTVFNVNGTTQALTIIPADGQSGTSTITITASNGVNSTNISFLLTVNLPGNGTDVFANTSNIAIPSSGISTPYPSTLNVSGEVGTITNLTVTLHGMSHPYPGHVNMLLVGPGGQAVVLMSDTVGNNPMTDLTFTLSDQAYYPLPPSSPLLDGTFQPTDYAPNHTNPAYAFPPPASAPPFSTNLGTFDGLSPNGTWSLYVYDGGPDGGGQISGGWSLAITTVSPPAIGGLTNQSTPVNTPTAAIPFQIYDAQTPASNLVLTATTSDPTVVAVGGIAFANSDNTYTNQTITLTPQPNTMGTATISVIVTDSDGMSATNSFVLTVNPAQLTVNVDSQTRPYGQTNAPLTGTLTGLQNGDTITASYSTSADTNSTVGLYPISVSLSDPDGRLSNYSVTTNNGSVTVIPAPLTVSAQDDHKTYDGVPYSGGNGVTYTGLVNGQDGSVLGGTLTYTGSSQGATNAGSYLITPAGLTSGNYAITFANGTLTINPATPTLTWGNPADIVYGTALGGTQLNATANVNGTFVYGPAGGTVLGAGNSQTLSATFTPSDSLNYNSAIATAHINVTQAPLTITADTLSRGYGATNPVFTASYNGFVNGDGSGVLTGTLSFTCLDTNAVAVDTNTPVGTYPIAVSGQSAVNYNLSYVNGTLTVTQAVLTVTADSLNRAYGATNPILTASYTGFVNGEYTNVLSGNPDLSTTADTNSAVGSYPIAISPGTLSTNGNYSFAFTNGTLTITAYALTVNVDSQTRPYGQTNAPLTGTLTGLQNGDTITASYSTSADTNSTVGLYPISVSLSDPDGRLSNYSVTTNNGSVTVIPAPLTVSAQDDHKTYDGVPYSGGNGVTYTGLVNGQDGSVLGGTLTYTGSSQGATNAGSYLITPAGLTSGNYAITFANGTLTINPATPTLTWGNPADIVYGTALGGTQLNATANVNGTFVYGPAGGTVLGAGNSQTLSATFTPSDSLNYNSAIATAHINVIPAPLTITADNKTKTQGLPNPALTASYSGFVNGDNTNALTTPVTLSTTADTNSPAAVYPITASGAVAANYAISYVSGTLTVVAQPNLASISASGNQFTLSWPTIVGQTYQVEYKDNLGDPAWTPLGSPMAGTGNPLTVNDSNNGTHRFYRLKITPVN